MAVAIVLSPDLSNTSTNLDETS